MPEREVVCTWQSRHTFDLPDDFPEDPNLDDFPQDALDAMTSHIADLVDWEVR